MANLTPIQEEVLQKGATGILWKGRWKYQMNNKVVTRSVNVLKDRGLVFMTYYPGGYVEVNKKR